MFDACIWRFDVMGTVRIFWKLNMALGKVFFGELIAQYINLPNFCNLTFFFKYSRLDLLGELKYIEQRRVTRLGIISHDAEVPATYFEAAEVTPTW